MACSMLAHTLYFDTGTKPGDTSKESKDDALAKQLWGYTEGLIAEKNAPVAHGQNK